MQRLLTISALALATMLGGTVWAADAPTINAQLINQDHYGQEAAATVKVDVTGAKLVSPDKEHEIAKKNEAHLHYQLDSGPIIATPDKELSFHGLTPGKHTITVTLAANNHQALTSPQQLSFDIPAQPGASTG